MLLNGGDPLYYGILVISVILFGVQTLFNDRYEHYCGSSATAAYVFTLLSSLSGLFFLLIINRFSVEVTPFTLFAATLSALCGILFTFCSLKALSKISISLYSLYSMLGGMLLPFLSGLIFYREPMTLSKGLCVFLIIAALLLAAQKERSRSDSFYCWCVFLLNGLFGVFAKYFESAGYRKTDSADYSIWIALISAVISGVILLTKRKSLPRLTFKSIACALGYGVFNRTANYLLLIALTVLPASVQYPFITGGVMTVSAVISGIVGQRPTKKEILAVCLSFVGIIILIVL